MTIDRLSPYAKYWVFLCFLCKSFANRDYSALIFNYEKTHRISKFSIKPFRTISIRYLSVFLLNLKLTIMFNWKYIFVSTGLFWSAMICFASCGSHFSSFFFSVISVNAWQGLKSWYTITMAFGLASQAQAKNHLWGQLSVLDANQLDEYQYIEVCSASNCFLFMWASFLRIDIIFRTFQACQCQSSASFDSVHWWR